MSIDNSDRIVPYLDIDTGCGSLVRTGYGTRSNIWPYYGKIAGTRLWQ
jgi:hypothetical protein